MSLPLQRKQKFIGRILQKEDMFSFSKTLPPVPSVATYLSMHGQAAAETARLSH